MNTFRPHAITFKCISLLIVLYSLIYGLFLKSKEQFCERPLLQPQSNGSHIISEKCQTLFYSTQDIQRCLQRSQYFLHSEQTSIFLIGSEKLEVLHNYFQAIDRKSSKFLRYDSPSKNISTLFSQWMAQGSHPQIVCIGFQPSLGTTSGAYENEIAGIRFNLDQIAQRSIVIWLEETTFNTATNSKEETLAASKFREVSKKVLHGTHVQFWNGIRKTPSFAPSEIEYNDKYFIQAIFNVLCNKYEGNDQLCCGSSWEPQDSFWFHVLIFGSTIAVATIYLMYDQLSDKLLKLLPSNHTQKVQDIEAGITDIENTIAKIMEFVFNATKFSLILGFFYICEKTSIFESANKHFVPYQFYVPLFVCLLLAYFTWRESSKNFVLNRDITDEWKGWMQIVILVYHATGASTVLPVYIYIRTLVSAYVFLTGFGHFSYYWSGKPMSLRRYCQVMLRMNILTIMLCVVMNNSYQLYYFVPLISFWYTMLYLFLLIPPTIEFHESGTKTNWNYIVGAIKIAILTTFIVVLSRWRTLFDTIFMFPVWKPLFTLGSDDYEWWFRWQLDRYSLVYGMSFSLGYNFYITKMEDFNARWMSYVKFLIGLTLVASFSCVLWFCQSKTECNKMHPYVVWIPILGFIILRHCTQLLKASHSQLLASIGRTSLELFVCQYHIWLSSNAKGILILFTVNSFINNICTTILFITCCYEVRDITSYFTIILIPKDNVKVIRNAVTLFLIIYICSNIF